MSRRKASTLVSCGTGFSDSNLELAKLSRVIKLDGCDGLVNVDCRRELRPVPCYSLLDLDNTRIKVNPRVSDVTRVGHVCSN